MSFLEFMWNKLNETVNIPKTIAWVGIAAFVVCFWYVAIYSVWKLVWG